MGIILQPVCNLFIPFQYIFGIDLITHLELEASNLFERGAYGLERHILVRPKIFNVDSVGGEGHRPQRFLKKISF